MREYWNLVPNNTNIHEKKWRYCHSRLGSHNALLAQQRKLKPETWCLYCNSSVASNTFLMHKLLMIIINFYVLHKGDTIILVWIVTYVVQNMSLNGIWTLTSMIRVQCSTSSPIRLTESWSLYNNYNTWIS